MQSCAFRRKLGDYILAFYWDNGKENGNCRAYRGLYRMYMGGCQNNGPFLGPDHDTAPNI